jgi:hypothetical protein
MICVALNRPTENPQDLSAADLILTDLAEYSSGGFQPPTNETTNGG